MAKKISRTVFTTIALLASSLVVAPVASATTTVVSTVSTAVPSISSQSNPSPAIESSCPSIDATNDLQIQDVTHQENGKNFLKLTQERIQDESIIINGSKTALDIGSSKVVSITDKNGRIFNYVVIPYRNVEGFNFISNITVVFENGDVSSPKSQSETLYTKAANGNFKVSSYQNGINIQEVVTNHKYVDGQKLQDTKDFHENAPRGKKAKVVCLSALLGVNATVATLVASTCVAACTAEPVGAAVCAACVGGVFALGGADIKGVIECLKL